MERNIDEEGLGEEKTDRQGIGKYHTHRNIPLQMSNFIFLLFTSVMPTFSALTIAGHTGEAVREACSGNVHEASRGEGGLKRTRCIVYAARAEP